MSQEIGGGGKPQHFGNLSSVRGTLQQPNALDTEDGLNQNIKMNDAMDKPEPGESTSNTRTD